MLNNHNAFYSFFESYLLNLNHIYVKYMFILEYVSKYCWKIRINAQRNENTINQTVLEIDFEPFFLLHLRFL